MRICYIYEITNNINGKTYIGQHHCDENILPDDDKYMGSGVKLHLAYKKYGIENFTKRILAICYTDKILDILEIYFIKEYRAIGKAQYNIANGGHYADNHNPNWRENLLRAIDSDEYHEKLSIAQRKRWSDESEHKRYSELNKCKWKDEKFRNKNINGRMGHKCSDETKRKIGEK